MSVEQRAVYKCGLRKLRLARGSFGTWRVAAMTSPADVSSEALAKEEVLAKEVPSAQEKASHVVRPLEIRAENMFRSESRAVVGA